MWRRITPRLVAVLACQRFGEIELALLNANALAPAQQVDAFKFSGTEEGRLTLISRKRSFDADFVRYVERVDPNRRDALPVNGETVANRLLIPLDAWEDDLVLRLLRQGPHVASSDAAGLRGALLERHDL